VQTFNKAAADILRQQPEQAVGQPLQQVVPVLGENFANYLRAVLDENQSRALETELDLLERGRMILNLKLSPLKDAEQNTQGVTMVVDDLTEQREREEKINLLRRYLPKNFLQNAEQIAGLTLQGERREMTCIFVDVRPFSTFPANLSTGEVMALLNEYLAVATDCIDKQNGVIDKYMGTEVMALFNTPLNEMKNDHAVKALEAALEMREAFVQLYRKQKINPNPHFYRLGMHTGWATTGNVGSANRRDFTALGDTINLAHRILENAEPGQMILSDSTCDSLKAVLGRLPQNVLFQAREPIKAKGRQQATPVFEVFRA
jgi:adenylate cyclase